MAFSSNGQLLAAGSLDRTIKIWEVGSGRELVTLQNGSMASSLVFLPLQAVVAAANEDGTVTVWDISQTWLLATLPCSEAPSPTLAINVRQSILLCGDASKGLIHRWDIKSFEPRRDIPVPTDTAAGTWKLLEGGDLLVREDQDGIIRLLNIVTFDVVQRFSTHNSGSDSAIAFAPRSAKVAVAHEYESIGIWSWRAPEAGSIPQEIHMPAPGVHAVVFSPDERLVAYAAENGDVVMLDLGGTEVKRLQSYSNRIENVGIADHSSVLSIQVWYDAHMEIDLRSGGLAQHEAQVISYDNADLFRPEGQFLDRQFFVRNRQDNLQIESAEGRLICTVVLLDKIGKFVIAAPDGRFDTNMDLSDIRGVHWIVSRKGLNPLPLEILMRDYYAPGLLPRLLMGVALPRLPGIAELNRIQPDVRIVSVKAGPTPDVALVEVE
ncbi:hypothetical protein NKJ88_32730, partial [Mesorhizobium sp. M0016]